MSCSWHPSYKGTSWREWASRDREFITTELFEEFDRYIEHGIPPSQFVRWCLQNELQQAANQASMVNVAILGWVGRFISRNVPFMAQSERVNEWIKLGGAVGWREANPDYER